MDHLKLTDTLRIVSKNVETADAFTFSFEIPANLKSKFQYSAGQFVTLFLKINGEEVRRSYSLCSSPDWDQEFKISVKRVPGGLVSNYLADQVSVGDTLNVTPPAGRFVLPSTSKPKDYVFFAAGSGITPILSLIKTVLKKNPSAKVSLLYANRDEYSIMFQRELGAINTDHHDRFRFAYVISQPLKAWDGFKGRVSAQMVKDFLAQNKVSKDAIAFMCGPEGFMATVEATLNLGGFSKDQIIKESFASSTPSNAVTQISLSTVGEAQDNYLEAIGPGAVLIGDKSLANAPKTLKAKLNGEMIEIPAKEGLSVLESLLEAGYNPPYSCMDGACMACLGKVKGGLVYQNDMGILTEDNTEIGECLTCQAKPASTTVEIDYDI